MKKILAIVLSLILMIGIIPLGTFAISVTSGNFKYTVSDGKAKITGCVEPTGDLEIPATLGGYPVTTIGDYAFCDCTGLTSITIPNSVTTIGDYAFCDCKGLTSVTIPNSVTTIGEYAFSGCKGLTSVTIPDSVTTICYAAFSGCTGLTEIHWNAKAVADFGSNVFRNAGTGGDGITVTFGNTVEKIPAYLFDVSNSSYYPKIRSITIGNSVTTIGEYAFYKCTGLTEIHWNAKAVADFDYDSNVFYNAGTAGDGITVTFGDSVEKVPAYAFYYCTGLTSVTIPNSVTSIGDGAFRDCTGLTSVTIPNSVTTIGYDAFGGCNNLKYNQYDNAKYLGNDTNPYLYLAKATSINITSCTIHENTKFIGDLAFFRCTGLTSITISDSVTTIGSYAFVDCTGLTEIYWNAKAVNGFEYLGCSEVADVGGVFNGAGTAGDGITVTFGDTVEKIPAYLFYIGDVGGYPPKIISITIGDSVTTIGSSAFDGCTGLTDVYYCGTKQDWDKISVDSGNTSLTNACIHYDYSPCPENGHTVGEVLEGELPFDCTKSSILTYICAHCGKTVTEEITGPHAGAVVLHTVDPTCTEDGYDLCRCTVCGTVYPDIIPALDHDFGEAVITTKPTCTETGIATQYCSRCDATKTAEVPALKHDYQSVVTPPTCRSEGYTTHTCTRCGKSYTDTFVPAEKEHHYKEGDWLIVSIPCTCEDDGYDIFKCRLCGEIYGDNIVPALGLEHEYQSVVTPSTCRQEGRVTYTCVHCGDSYITTVPTVDHSYESQIFPATCTTDGYTVYTCKVCGDTYTVPGVSAQGHFIFDGSCVVCGKTERECENLKVGSQIRNGETRLILKLCDSVEKIGNYLDVGFVVTIDGIEVTVKLDRVYSGFYNGGTMISAEDLGATYVAIAEIGNISAAQTVTAQGFYTDPDGTVNYGIKRSLK